MVKILVKIFLYLFLDDFGNEEVLRFFENQKAETANDMESETEEDPISFDMSAAYDEYINRNKTLKTVLVQRNRPVFLECYFQTKI